MPTMNSLLSKLRSRLRILGTYFGIALVSLIISYLLFLEFDEDEWVSANYADYIDELVFNGAPVAGCLLICLCFFGFVIIPGVSVVLAHEEWVELKVDEKKEREEKQRREEKLLLKEKEEINFLNKLAEDYHYSSLKQLLESLRISVQDFYDVTPTPDQELAIEEMENVGRLDWNLLTQEEEMLTQFTFDIVGVLSQVKKAELIPLAKKYEISTKGNQRRNDLMIAILDAQKFGSSKKGILKRLEQEIAQEEAEKKKATRKAKQNTTKIKKSSKPKNSGDFRFIDALTATWCPLCNSRMEGKTWGYYCASCDTRFDENAGAL